MRNLAFIANVIVLYLPSKFPYTISTEEQVHKKNYIMLFWTTVGHVGGRLQQSTMENREMKIFGVEYYCPPKNEGKTGTTWRLNNFKIMIMCITY